MEAGTLQARQAVLSLKLVLLPRGIRPHFWKRSAVPHSRASRRSFTAETVHSSLTAEWLSRMTV